MRRILFAVVILSEDCASRSEAQPQSKDPFHLPPRLPPQGISIRAFYFSYFFDARTELSCRRFRTIK
jgi:hypothetical protein